jgi:hypothetical protein
MIKEINLESQTMQHICSLNQNVGKIKKNVGIEA